MTNVNIDELNGQAVLALIMGAVRAERFCSGALEGFLQNGSIIKWLKRLKNCLMHLKKVNSAVV